MPIQSMTKAGFALNLIGVVLLVRLTWSHEALYAAGGSRRGAKPSSPTPEAAA